MLHRIQKHPLALFFVLVFVLEWAAVLALVPLSPMAVGVMALVPTPAAFLAAAIAEGRKGTGRLIRRSLSWRLGLKWYALAILIPVLLHLFAAAAAVLAGATLSPEPGALVAYLPLTLLLAVGEEIGWQGYALPRLRERFSPLLTAAIFGLLHASFHLPMYVLALPAELRQASPFPLFLLMVTAFALYRVWFFEQTGGNVPQIVVYHAAINTSVLLLAGIEPALLAWLLPLTWVLGAQPLLVARGMREDSGESIVHRSSTLPPI